MKIEQLYTACLAQGAYYIESDGEAVVIDPIREVSTYIETSISRNAKIKYIFETHFHADFVSGHVELANKTGATIVYGPTQMKTGFNCLVAKDGDFFEVGRIRFKLIHTPGHTLESSCFLLIDEEGIEKALFTGDTLFIGDVGRPDLAQHVIADLTEEKLAGYLYDSLRNKILPLSDDIIIYPGHGAGSACGKNLSTEKMDTLGNQKLKNPSLRKGLSKEQFIKELLIGLTPPPGYFPKNVMMNIKGSESLDTVMFRGTKKISVNDFKELVKDKEVIILDTRDPADFAIGHIPGSLNIGINGSFAVWVGTLIHEIDKKIAFIAYPGKEKEVIIRLARVGYDNPIGYLEGGIETWKNASNTLGKISSISVQEFVNIQSLDPSISILDVRKQSEYNSEHLINAINFPLDYFENAVQKLNKEQKYYVHCAGGYRSMIFISLLKLHGFNNLINVEGGFAALKKFHQLSFSDYSCPSTML